MDKNWISWEVLYEKVTVWNLGEFEQCDLEVLEEGEYTEVVTAVGL